MESSTLSTPSGLLRITEHDSTIVGVTWAEKKTTSSISTENKTLLLAIDQLNAYFEGSRTEFDLPLAYKKGSPFEHRVWDAMKRIPYGEIWTYGELAEEVGGVARAVGGACGANPIPIIIPCHRVVGANGKLTGFSGGRGIETKRFLLDMEQGQRNLF